MRLVPSRMPRHVPLPPPPLAVVVGLTLILAACSESIPTPPTVSSVQARMAQQRRGPSRTDTPWRRMTDDELSARIADAGGRVFIGFKDAHAVAGVEEFGLVIASPAAVALGKAQLRALGVDIEFEFLRTPAVVARIPAALTSQLRQNPLIEYVEPIVPGVRDAQTITWNVSRVNAPPAWSYSTGSGAKLLIIDSGVEDTHPDLAPAVIQACDGTNGRDQAGHGTMVAGIAAALNNDIQIVGVAHGIALWTSKDGDAVPNSALTACGVQFGRINNVHAINISTGYDSPNTTLTDEINGAYDEGIVIVASAGNTNGGAVKYPASLGSVIAVSATDTNNNFASFSAAGSKVEVTAPGTTVTNTRGVTTTCLGGVTCAVQGTSFSAPHVAAAAALLKAYNPSWSNTEIRRRLGAGATDLGPAGRDAQFGYGLLNIVGAITAPPPPPPPTVSIGGPTSVRPNTQCLWEASVSGMPPFTYYWTKDGGFVSSQSTVTTSFAVSGILSVQVWDANGVAYDSRSITVSPSAPRCFF